MHLSLLMLPLSLSLCRVCGSCIDLEFDGKLKNCLERSVV